MGGGRHQLATGNPATPPASCGRQGGRQVNLRALALQPGASYRPGGLSGSGSGAAGVWAPGLCQFGSPRLPTPRSVLFISNLSLVSKICFRILIQWAEYGRLVPVRIFPNLSIFENLILSSVVLRNVHVDLHHYIYNCLIILMLRLSFLVITY